MLELKKNLNNSEQTAWLARAKKGDDAAFEKIVEQYQSAIRNFCYRKLNSAEEAEEAMQETFLRAYTRLDSYDERRKFSTWLFSIAANYCTDLLRKRQVRLSAQHTLELQQHLLAQETAPEKLLLNVEAEDEIRALLNYLPTEHYTPVVLKYWHNMSYKEIAQSMNTSVSAIKSRLFRARQTLAAAAV